MGIAWLFILPLNEYSRATYISENAILPGQVHTYFGGSEHNVFRAYRQEVWTLSHYTYDERIAGVEQVLRENGLKVATQSYSWKVAGEDIAGKNVYGIIQGPRADATEAMVLIAAWRNLEGDINYSGVALALTLARYFKRWSIWSKDIVVLIPDDSTYGPEAWVSAYHSTTSEVTSNRNVSALPIKAGALQGVVALDYPAGPWGQRFDKLDVLYDGINGALPNLDLLNTAVQVANGQMGISCTLHDFNAHRDSYRDRLLTIAKGIKTQGVGHATGPHSAFMPYHVDAITLKTTGDGWHDEITLGRTTESLIRSINNLLEHFHQSFFFYILLSPNRFVSIGNYLPAAMIIAGSFTITALALWIQSAKVTERDVESEKAAQKQKEEKLEMVKEGDAVAFVPKSDLQVVERKMLVPAVFVLAAHLAAFIPLYLLNHTNRAVSSKQCSTLATILTTSQNLSATFYGIATASFMLPFTLASTLATHTSPQQVLTIQSFSLLLLGAALSMLATLNFSLALVIGILCSPFSFIRPLPSIPLRSDLKTKDDAQNLVLRVATAALPTALLFTVSPPVVLYAINHHFVRDMEWVLLEMAKGWNAQGVWTSLVIWGVWWPAWVIGGSVLFSGTLRRGT